MPWCREQNGQHERRKDLIFQFAFHLFLLDVIIVAVVVVVVAAGPDFFRLLPFPVVVTPVLGVRFALPVFLPLFLLLFLLLLFRLSAAVNVAAVFDLVVVVGVVIVSRGQAKFFAGRKQAAVSDLWRFKKIKSKLSATILLDLKVIEDISAKEFII